MRQWTTKEVTGIGLIRIPAVSVYMQVPFTELDLIIDTYYIVLEETVPTKPI